MEKEAKKQKLEAAESKVMSEEETNMLLSTNVEIETGGIGALSGVQDDSDQPVNKDHHEVAKSEVEGEASPYEMASMAEKGLATESLDLPSNITDNNALLTDVSIADQCAALSEMKEVHKEDMKQAIKIEIEKKKKEEETKKNQKL